MAEPRLGKIETLFDDDHRVMLAIADSLQALRERMDQSFTEVRTEIRKMNARIDVVIKEHESTSTHD